MDTAVIQILSLFVCLLGGGGNDLLDYLPTEAYWEVKGVPIRLETMAAEINPPQSDDVSANLTADIAQLGAADPQARQAAELRVRRAGAAATPFLQEAMRSPEAERAGRAKDLLGQIADDMTVARVRRLMAIRTLGELGQPGARQTLAPLVEASEPFEAEYAAAALAALDGKPRARPRPIAAIAQDVWSLPASSRAVLQLAPRGGGPVGYADLLAAMKMPPDADRHERLAEVIGPVLEVAELLGNVRIDAITVGIDQRLSNDAGFVVALGRGLYNSDRLRAALRQSRTPWHTEQGVEVFEPNADLSLVVLSDNELLLLASPQGKDRPLAKVLAARRDDAVGLKSVASMTQLIGQVDAASPLWAAARMTDGYRQFHPSLAPFDSMTLTGQEEKGALQIRLSARGREGVDPANVSAAAGRAALDKKQAVEFLRPIMQVAPLLRTLVDFLETVEIKADGSSATLTAQLAASPAAVLSVSTALEHEGAPPEPPRAPPVIR